MLKNSGSQQIRIWQPHKRAHAQHVLIVKIPLFKFVLYPLCRVNAIVFGVVAVILTVVILRHYRAFCSRFDATALFLVNKRMQ